MSKVITVSRELGSGGREVGLRLAKKLGIPFYDKELIAMAAEDSNISEDLFHANDEVIAGQKRINYDDYATVDPFSPVYEVPVSDQLFVIQSKIIRQAVGLAVSEFGGGKSAAAAPERTQRDISIKRILTILIATLISVFVFFHFGLLDGWVQSVTAILIVFIIAFLFTTVAANAIAIVGTNPVSGMTLMTLILSSLVLVSVGLSGTTGMTAALVIGGVVCTALSMAGGFITDLKIGYWLGTTPRKQEAWKFLGTFVAAATVAGVMIILNKSYGFVGEGALVAPQANAMAAVIQPLMTGGQTPWMLYFCGAALALVLTSIGVPALAFALGMFIPMELNAPLVVGGLVAWFVSGRSKDEGLNKARFDRGTLIASGFIAGGALMGVVSAVLKFVGVDWFLSGWASSNAAEWTGLAMYLVLIGYFAWHTLRAKKEE